MRAPPAQNKMEIYVTAMFHVCGRVRSYSASGADEKVGCPRAALICLCTAPPSSSLSRERINAQCDTIATRSASSSDALFSITRALAGIAGPVTRGHSQDQPMATFYGTAHAFALKPHLPLPDYTGLLR